MRLFGTVCFHRDNGFVFGFWGIWSVVHIYLTHYIVIHLLFLCPIYFARTRLSFSPPPSHQLLQLPFKLLFKRSLVIHNLAQVLLRWDQLTVHERLSYLYVFRMMELGQLPERRDFSGQGFEEESPGRFDISTVLATFVLRPLAAAIKQASQIPPRVTWCFPINHREHSRVPLSKALGLNRMRKNLQ